MNDRLHYETTEPALIDPTTRGAMFALFSQCYDCVTEAQFERDLLAKLQVVLLCDETKVVRGFSTMEWFDWRFEGETVRILFSGDTVIEPRFWGSNALVKGWCDVAARVLAMKPERRLFWFLISKGFRTYRFLPLFFRHFIPRVGAPMDPRLKRLLDEVAAHKFGAHYDRDTGLIRFDESKGQLVGELALIPPAKQEDPHVRFFHQTNPDYAQGVELACMTEVSFENTHGLGRRWLGRALVAR